MRKAARVGAASATFALTLGLAAPAAAADVLGPFPACQGFNVTLEDGGDANQNLRTFTDKDGHEVAVTTGRAGSVKVTNNGTGQSVTVPSRGARIESVDNGDGTTTVTWTGNLLLLLFDSD